MATAKKSSSSRSRSAGTESRSKRGTTGSRSKTSSGGSRSSSEKKKSSSGRKYSRKAQTKVGKVMKEYKQGKLKSGGRSKVKSRKQAIAIGISEARKSGAKVPRKKAS